MNPTGKALLSCIAGLIAVSAGAQPTNDLFSQRVAIDGTNSTISGSLENATAEAGEPLLAGISSGQTAWWDWTAPSNGLVSFSISATNFHPLLTVYRGEDLPNLTLVASNLYQICYSDGVCGCHWRERSGTTFHVASGETFSIQIDSAISTDATLGWHTILITNGLSLLGFGPIFHTNVFPGGPFALTFNFTPAPANDDFQNSIQLSGERAQVRTSNAGASKQTGEPDHAGNPGGSSVWFSWRAPASGRVTLSTNNIPPYGPPTWTSGDPIGVITTMPGPLSCGAEVDQDPPPEFFPVFGVYTGAAVDALATANPSPLGLESYPRAIEFDATAGQNYQIAFDGNKGTTGDLTLYLALTTPAENDNFKNRIHVRGTDVVAYSYNAGATHEAGEPTLPGATGKSVWWSWTAPVSGPVTIDLRGSDYVFPVAVFTGKDVAQLTAVASGYRIVSFQAEAGHEYEIMVSDANGHTGGINLFLREPLVELPLLSKQRGPRISLLSYRSSIGHHIMLQQWTGTRWQIMAEVTARSPVVQFAVRDGGGRFRAIVVDHFASGMLHQASLTSIEGIFQGGQFQNGHYPPPPPVP